MTVALNTSPQPNPRDHLLFSEHLTASPHDAPIRETFLGQAHIAGTGPEGRTCRECQFWHAWKNKNNSPWSDEPPMPCAPGYYGKRHPKAGEIKKARCNRPILNKAQRNIPHFAKACRLFEPAETPPAIKKEEA